jgi:hypothetical protein
MTKNFLILFAFLLCFGSIQVYAQTSPTDTPSETPTASATPTATGCAAVGNIFQIQVNPATGGTTVGILGQILNKGMPGVFCPDSHYYVTSITFNFVLTGNLSTEIQQVQL